MTHDDSSGAAPASGATPRHFIQQEIDRDRANGRYGGRVQTRFPPEPNGYLHIGHAKAICVNFMIADEYGGKCNLRFDDTNPTAEDVEYVDAIIEDIRWLGFDWEDRLYYASDYFEQLYEWAVGMIKAGKAYVDDLKGTEISEYRGTLTTPGKDSPWRDRSVEDNLDLFARMRAGEFPDGSRVLRAKIDMASPHLLLRDPVMYRILHAEHHRTGKDWTIYPLYDFAHGQSDAIEGITHSMCSLEFENHRPLYDWYLQQLDIPEPPRQIEFSRLNLTNTVMSKRFLRDIVKSGHVDGWDDPRMPTLRGFRRRGYTPESIRKFCTDIGVTKVPGMIEMSVLENTLREELNKTAPRAMAVLDPIKLVITNYPEGQTETLTAINNPEDESAGTREVPFGRELWIEREDFLEDPPKKFFRLGPGREVRLRYAYYVTCVDFVKDDDGNVIEVRCEYDPATRGGNSPDGRKVKGTIHWVSVEHAVDASVRLYEPLFNKRDPNDLEEGEELADYLTPDSVQTLSACKLEPSLGEAGMDVRFQFERKGYFWRDSKGDGVVFLRIVGLRDSWAKVVKRGE